MKFIKTAVPPKHLITPPTCQVVECDRPAKINSAYNKGQKYKRVCNYHHEQRLAYLRKCRENKEPGQTLEQFFNLKKFYTVSLPEAENSLVKFFEENN